MNIFSLKFLQVKVNLKTLTELCLSSLERTKSCFLMIRIYLSHRNLFMGLQKQNLKDMFRFIYGLEITGITTPSRALT